MGKGHIKYVREPRRGDISPLLYAAPTRIAPDAAPTGASDARWCLFHSHGLHRGLQDVARYAGCAVTPELNLTPMAMRPYARSSFTWRVLPVGARRRLAPTSSLPTRVLSTDWGLRK